MKKVTLLLALFAMIFTASAFNNAASAADPLEIMVSYPNQPGEPVDQAINYWAQILKEESNGEIILTPFPSGQLGAQEDVRAQAQMGAPIITTSSYGSLADLVPDLGVVNAPYVGTSVEQKMKLIKTKKFVDLLSQLDPKGIHVICPDSYYGTRQLMANVKAQKPEDMNGIKIRVQNTKIAGFWAKSVGAVPTPMPLSEAYTAISQGIVEGIENPPGTLEGGKFYEQLKYLIMTNHDIHLAPWVMGSAFWESLTPKQQELLTSTAAKMSKFATKIVEGTEQDYIDKMAAQGVEVVEVDVQPYVENALKVMKGNFPEWTPNLYEDTLNSLSEMK